MTALGLAMPLLAAGGWLWWIYQSDRFEKEPWSLILWTAGLGAAAGLISVLLTATVWPGLHTPLDLAGILAAMLGLAYRSSDWNERFDGLVYGGSAGLGYGLVFTLPALLQDATLGFRLAIFSMPVYMMTGIVLGHHASLAKLQGRWWAWARGLVIAAVFLLGIEYALGHGGTVVSGPNMLAGLMAYASNMLAWILATRAMDLTNGRSPLNPGAHRILMTGQLCRACGAPRSVGARFCHRCGRLVPARGEA